MLAALLFLFPALMFLMDPMGSDSDDDVDEPEVIEVADAEPETSIEEFIEQIEVEEPVEVEDPEVHVVSETFFGANAVYGVHTEDGNITETFDDAVDAFDIEQIRFPAGQAEYDEGDVEAEDWIDITELTEDGGLRSELVEFMDDFEGEVLLTISTTNDPLETYGEDLTEWAKQVMLEYGDKIAGFEIGNEYWGHMTETEYGQKADIAALALADGIEAADNGDPEILVQMGSTYDHSEFASSVDSRSFDLRLTDANETIINQLSDEAREEIDGVVDHYYWNKSPIPFEDTSAEVRYMDEKFEIWQANFDHDLDFLVTEWNLKMNNCECNGLRSMAILVEMVENMVELDVDGAYVWPLVHNATNDLGGPADDGEVITDDEGRVTETVRGAIFDLMSEALPGKELIDVDIDGVENGMEIAAYQHDGEYVFYIGSNSLTQESFTVDLGSIIPNFDSAEGVQISYDRATSDGQHYSPGVGKVDALSVQIDGEDYFLNEHDTQAVLTDYNYDAPEFEVVLNPYEVIQITAR